ncbi:hypothetical protein MCOR25_001164 [Pyricularia grisea]|nr:hypothetical protein MCOR25_001164 [Pyricularia grisea]
MGLNAYFTYQVVGVRGTGSIPYGLALTAVFVEGFIFILLAITGMRHWLVKIVPGTLKTASGVGIGLFLTLVGMSYGNGIGLVTGSVSTPLTIGGCPPEDLYRGECPNNIMQSHKMWFGIFGGLLTAWLMAFRVKSAIIIGIAIVSILSWPRNTSLTYFPHTDEGDSRFEFFRKIADFHPIQHTLGAQEWDLSGGNGAKFAIAVFTFLYVDIIDCTATLYSMARFCNKVDEKDGDFPRSTLAYCTDAACISFGSLLGCSPVTVFVESGAGIAEGGRTGLTAIITGICFLVSIFFAPIFASIPPWATGCTLILRHIRLYCDQFAHLDCHVREWRRTGALGVQPQGVLDLEACGEKAMAFPGLHQRPILGRGTTSSQERRLGCKIDPASVCNRVRGKATRRPFLGCLSVNATSCCTAVGLRSDVCEESPPRGHYEQPSTSRRHGRSQGYSTYHENYPSSSSTTFVQATHFIFFFTHL